MDIIFVEDHLQLSEGVGYSKVWDCHLKSMLELPSIGTLGTAIEFTLRAEVSFKPEHRLRVVDTLGVSGVNASRGIDSFLSIAIFN